MTTPADNDIIGERVRRLREARGWTQVDLANASGISQATISAVENGRTASPGTPTISRLAAALGASLSGLAEDDCPPSEKDLPLELRAQIAALPLWARDEFAELIAEGKKFPDTDEGRAAFVEGIRVALVFMRGRRAELEDK